MDPIASARAEIENNNPLLFQSQVRRPAPGRMLGKVLVANRGEIAKRFFFALKEEGIGSVAVVADPDRGQSWYESADEVVYIGDAANYARGPVILAAVELSRADGLYPGYGFLSENPDFRDSLSTAPNRVGRPVVFLGPPADVMRAVSHKQPARALAAKSGVPLFSGSERLSDLAGARAAAERIGYPIMLKLDAGGGGQGMHAIESEENLAAAVESAQRIGNMSYGNPDFYLEKLIVRPVHVEVQIFNGTAIGIRKCAVQRRNQKVIEESGDAFLDTHTALRLLAAAETMAAACGYSNGGGAGTIEFLFDDATGDFGFLEVNTRLQVEYPVTDQSLGIDLVRWQILCFDGRADQIPYERALRLRFVEKQHAIQCRVYAEDPRRTWAPAPGRIVDLDLPTFNGVRCDFGFKAGDAILSQYDPMIGKLIAFGVSREEALLRMERALGELYVRGVTTNVEQLLEVVRHPDFRSGRYTNRILGDHPELSTPRQSPEELRDAAVFAAVAEMSAAIAEAVDACFDSDDLEELLQGQALLALPTRFSVEPEQPGQKAHQVQFIQWALRSYHVAVDDEPRGSITITLRGQGTSDLHIIYQGRAVPVRVDRRADQVHIRATASDGRVRYYRMRVRQLGTGRAQDPAGMVRSPFQGTFVRFATDAEGGTLRPGSTVAAGQPLLVVSAMKMETTLTAPVSGRVTYLVDDGDLRRLVRGSSDRGLVLGRSLAEGEALAVIQDTAAGSAALPGAGAGTATADEPLDFVNHLIGLASPNDALTDPGPRQALNVLRGVFLGYLIGRASATHVKEALAQPDRIPAWPAYAEEYRTILEIYTHLKQMYSPALGKNQTWFGEMHRLLADWDNDTYRPPYFFRTVMARLLRHYGVPDDQARKNNADLRLTFFFILRGYHAVSRHADFMDTILKAMSDGAPVTRQILKDLHRFVEQELPDREDARARVAQRLLRSMRERGARDRSRASTRAGMPPLSREDLDFVEEVSSDVWSRFEENALATIDQLRLGQAPAQPGREPRAIALPYVGRFRRRAAVFVLPSPYDDVDILFFRHSSGDSGFYCLTYLAGGNLDVTRDAAGNIVDAPGLRRAAARTGRVLAAYSSGDTEFHNHVHMFAADKPTEFDLPGSDPALLNQSTLRRIVTRTLKYYQHIRAQMVVVDLLGVRPGENTARRIHINIYTERGHAAFDILEESDRQHPFWNGEERPLEQRLYDRRKWPIDRWAEFAFDAGSQTEILFASVDVPGAKPVGARVFRGTLGGAPALFFMKDSRVRGGATGDREGRKYAAALVLAYLLDLPFYIWNDGAGADIREGMVSLSRAAEGFFLNALTNSRVSYARFRRLVAAHPDSAIRGLLEEVESLAPEIKSGSAARPSRFFMTAVGVGSATGLDVYGSSQAALQIMLDSQQSYRVLTGAAVVQSVTGEELTNYEIGGAGVMGRWTGTVDFTAIDKLDLLAQVRRLHLFFSRGTPKRTQGEAAARSGGDTPDFTVLNEKLIESVADGGEFLNSKSEYQDAAALLGGFARFGGVPALVMGPRTQTGIRSQASVLKARDLVRTADRLELPRVLVFGRRWYRGAAVENEEAVRARMDFLSTLTAGKQPRIHVLRHHQAIRRVSLNSGADVLIYVRTGAESAEELALVRKTTAFVCDSLADAFTLVGKLLALLAVPSGVRSGVASDPASDSVASEPDARVILPEAGQPFDMRSAVIGPLLDPGSVLVFHQVGEGPGKEPNLVTALGRLGGRPVGIIADQPLHGGAPDAPGTEKFRMFMQLLERRSLPLVMLSNAPGFVPGTKQERLRIQQIGGESLDVNVLSRIPVVSVVLRQNYGGRQIHAFGRNLRPGIVALALDDAIMAVMGAEASFNLFKGKEHQQLLAANDVAGATRLRDEYIREFKEKARADHDALSSGTLDRVVAGSENLRAEIIRALQEAQVLADQLSSVEA